MILPLRASLKKNHFDGSFLRFISCGGLWFFSYLKTEKKIEEKAERLFVCF